MTSLFIHHNEDIFPNSQSFVPERWMDAAQRKHLEKYLAAFSKGSRQCIGIPYVFIPWRFWKENQLNRSVSLAKAEILLAVATIFREFEMRLYKTSIDDVRVARDMFNGHPKRGSQGVRVMIKEWHETPKSSENFDRSNPF